MKINIEKTIAALETDRKELFAQYVRRWDALCKGAVLKKPDEGEFRLCDYIMSIGSLKGRPNDCDIFSLISKSSHNIVNHYLQE